MKNIGKKVAHWVDSQKEIAENIGISSPSMHSMLTGKMKLPLTRFLQIIFYLNPPQEEVNEIFNFYLKDLDIPENSITLSNSDTNNTGKNEISLSSCNKINKIIDAVMEADLDNDSKVKVYNIIKSVTRESR